MAKKVETAEDIDTSICPNCESDNIDAFDSESNETTHVDNYSCGDCEAQWDAVYQLTGIENLKLADDEDDPDEDDEDDEEPEDEGIDD